MGGVETQAREEEEAGETLEEEEDRDEEEVPSSGCICQHSALSTIGPLGCLVPLAKCANIVPGQA